MSTGDASTVWLDGALLPRAQASVSIDDLGFLYGAACFETMRAVAGRVFRLERHFERLESGLAALSVTPPPRETLREAVRATLEANALAEARVRLTVSAGRGTGRPDLTAPAAPTVLVVTEPRADPPAAARLAVASQRLDERRPLPGAKTANYLLSLLALAGARERGCDDALLLNHAGHVAEAATANLFAVIDGELVTPPLDDGPLPGITREAVLGCAAALPLRVSQRSLTLEQVLDAGELFLTSSVFGPRPVAAVDERWRAERCPGPVTASLSVAYERLVQAECGARA